MKSPLDVIKSLRTGGDQPKFYGPNHSSPEEFILSFARDYKVWNDFCINQAESNEDHNKSQKLYELFLKPYILDGIRTQLASYGTESSFDPDRIKFIKFEKFSTEIRVIFTAQYNESSDDGDDHIVQLDFSEKKLFRISEFYYIDKYANYGESPILWIL